jgi:hypothetical protein
MKRRMSALALACAFCLGQASVADELREAYIAIDTVKSEAGSVPNQAIALTELAWSADPGDPTVIWLARQQLVEFGENGLTALRRAIHTAPKHMQADVVSAIMEARSSVSAGLPQVYLPALEEALWFGSFEARRLVIPELAAHRYRPALITLMDAAIEFPALTDSVTNALAIYGNDKSRHYLLGLMRDGTMEQGLGAADALAQIGGRAMGTLREAVRDESLQVRRVAMDGLLPISSIQDLSLIYDFVAANSDVDPDFMRRVIERAELLEVLLDRQHQAESATSID